jgi:hypothetical protein
VIGTTHGFWLRMPVCTPAGARWRASACPEQRAVVGGNSGGAGAKARSGPADVRQPVRKMARGPGCRGKGVVSWWLPQKGVSKKRFIVLYVFLPSSDIGQILIIMVI